MGGQDDVKPLAPAAERRARPISDEEAAAVSWVSASRKHGGRRRCVLCCGCCIGAGVFLAVLILVLALTVFKVKDPEITMNSFSVDRLEFNPLPPPRLNLTVTADISVKNPNAASFKFGNATTAVSYRGKTVGEAKSPAGKARARRTLRLNVTMDLLADRLLGDGGKLLGDVVSGSIPVTTYTKLGGRVNVLHLFKRHVDVTMNCSLSISVSSQSIQNQTCKRSVKI